MEQYKTLISPDGDALAHAPTFDEMVGLIEKNFKDVLELSGITEPERIADAWRRYKTLNHLYQDIQPPSNTAVDPDEEEGRICGELIDRHIGKMFGSLESASIKHFLEKGVINGNFRLRLIAMMQFYKWKLQDKWAASTPQGAVADEPCEPNARVRYWKERAAKAEAMQKGAVAKKTVANILKWAAAYCDELGSDLQLINGEWCLLNDEKYLPISEVELSELYTLHHPDESPSNQSDAVEFVNWIVDNNWEMGSNNKWWKVEGDILSAPVERTTAQLYDIFKSK